MSALRTISARPQVIVGGSAVSVVADTVPNVLGVDGPRTRNRLQSALPLNKSKPVQLAPPLLLAAGDGSLIADPSGVMLGERNALWCHRWLSATRTPALRR